MWIMLLKVISFRSEIKRLRSDELVFEYYVIATE